jgi:cytidylate kinase
MREKIGGPALARLVDRQMRNWELARSQRLAVPEPKRPEVEDFLCLSRLVGVNGLDVAGRLARRLDWPMFDKELLDAMAGNDRIRRLIYTTMDERDLSWGEAMLRTLGQPELARDDYFHRLCDTVLTLARQGSCVFVGRGADLILPHDRGFRVQLIAARAHRIDALARHRKLTPARAEQELERTERDRAQFLRRHFGASLDDAARHDLTVNLDRFTSDQAVDVVLAARDLRRRG